MYPWRVVAAGLAAAGEGPLPDLGSEALPSLEVEDGILCDWIWRIAWGHAFLSYLVVLFRHEGVDTHQRLRARERGNSQFHSWKESFSGWDGFLLGFLLEKLGWYHVWGANSVAVGCGRYGRCKRVGSSHFGISQSELKARSARR